VAQTNHPDHAALFANNLTGTPFVYLGTRYNAVEAHSGGGAAIDAAVAIYGVATNPSNDWAGYFEGPVVVDHNLDVSGSLHVSGDKFFTIDHPLDPANKTLTHACIESNERLLMYSGTAITDANGGAIISLPSYFETLNTNYRYQLTAIGQFAQAIIAEKIHDNRFSIRTDKPNIEVSWLVIGDRNDAYSKTHPFVAEVEKKPEDRGKYIRPDLFGQPETKRIGYRAPRETHQNKPVPSLRPEPIGNAPAEKEKQ
jgi:hypothetical protein